MVSINPGDLRYKIGFYTLQTVSDGSGGTEGDPVQVLAFSRLAKVTQKSGKRADQAGSLAIFSYYEIVIRYAEGQMPTAGMIVKHNGKELLLNAITEIDEQKALIMLIAGKS